MAYVSPAVVTAAREAGDGATGRLTVDIRGRAEPATLVDLPFYHRPA
jgi:hypothetical protein